MHLTYDLLERIVRNPFELDRLLAALGHVGAEHQREVLDGGRQNDAMGWDDALLALNGYAL